MRRHSWSLQGRAAAAAAAAPGRAAGGARVSADAARPAIPPSPTYAPRHHQVHYTLTSTSSSCLHPHYILTPCLHPHSMPSPPLHPHSMPSPAPMASCRRMVDSGCQEGGKSLSLSRAVADSKQEGGLLAAILPLFSRWLFVEGTPYYGL